MKPKADKPAKLTIEFPNEEMRHCFAIWLSDGGGEDDYYQACVNSKLARPHFHYHGPENEKYAVSDKRRYGTFLGDNTIRITKHTDP